MQKKQLPKRDDTRAPEYPDQVEMVRAAASVFNRFYGSR